MSLNPFSADRETATRMAALQQRLGAAIRREISDCVRAGNDLRANSGSVLKRADADGLIERHQLAGIEDLMLLALPAAQELADPPISNFHVGAVGLERETGNLVLGGNLEFPGTHLGYTVHAEGFVFTRAFSRGTTIATLALGEAHPCAHCRQYLSEFATSADLVLIDPLGHRLTLAQLYPWPFDPDYLRAAGAVPGKKLWNLRAGDAKLAAAGARSHTPYSKCPAAAVVTLNDGGQVVGKAIESVAFNPTIGPLQASLIDLVAHGRRYDEIASVKLGTVLGGAVDYSTSADKLLSQVAPQARLDIVGWTI